MSTIPAEIQARIDDERRRLQQAAEVLAALAIAFEEDLEGAAIAVRGMIDTAVTNLDGVSLRRSL